MQIMYWQGLSKYAVQGWLAWMLLLPMKVHLIVNLLELLLFYAVGVQIERLYHGHGSFFHWYHFITSLCLVHTDHSHVALLSPLLTSCLASQLGQLSAPGAGSSALPAYMQAACFAGCVQLLANIFILKDAATSGNSASNLSAPASRKGQGGVREAAVSHAAVAETLLVAVQTEALASTSDKLPRATVAVAAPGQFKLLSCEPACLVAGRQQQLKLHVCPAGQQQLAGPDAAIDNMVRPDCQGVTGNMTGSKVLSTSQGAGGEPESRAGDAAVRLLVLTDGAVLLDQEVLVCGGVVR
eukprot:gene10121-10279_t